MFSMPTVAYVQRRIESVRERTGRTLLVVTLASLTNAQVPGVLDEEAQRILEQRGADAVLYIDRDDRLDSLVARPQRWFTSTRIAAIRATMERNFADGRYDLGLRSAVAKILAVYTAGAAMGQGMANAAPPLRAYGWLAVAILLYLVVRGAARRRPRPRH